MNSDAPKERSSATSIADDCVIHNHLVPPEEITRHTFERDPHAEREIARYVEIEVPEQTVHHVERIKTEHVLGDVYEVWDVVTDKDRWWVITNLTNLYSQKHFPSLDYTLSFHIGLMARLRSRSNLPDPDHPHPFDEVARRRDQAEKLYQGAIEPEDFQAVGMQLREALLVLCSAMQRSVELPANIERPKVADFIAWSETLMNHLCPSDRNKTLRQYLKSTAEKTWQLTNWLTHDKSANKMACTIALHATDTLTGHFAFLLSRDWMDKTDKCPICSSRKIRSHFDADIGSDGDYYETCGSCSWSSHPTRRLP